jgi:hypothetical protein
MENEEKCVENGKSEMNGDAIEQQYDGGNIMEHDEIDNNVFDFEAHFNGNELGSGDEYDDDRSFQIR